MARLGCATRFVAQPGAWSLQSDQKHFGLGRLMHGYSERFLNSTHLNLKIKKNFNGPNMLVWFVNQSHLVDKH